MHTHTHSYSFSRSPIIARSAFWLLFLGGALGIRLLLMALIPYVDTSEPRYAEIARFMAESGDWITPWWHVNVPFWGKPPLAFWSAALSIRAFGLSEFAGRLPAWLVTLATLAVIHALTRHLYGQRVARLAVVIYITCCLHYLAAGAVLTDAYLAFAVTLSMAGVLMGNRRSHPFWRYAVFMGLAIGMLAKGPLAILLVLGVAVPWAIWQGQVTHYVKEMPWARGLGLFLLLTLPWYVAAEIKTPGFLHYFLIGEHLSRFLNPGWQGDMYGTAHQRMYGGIWLDWLLATFPWGFLAIWKFITNADRAKVLKRIVARGGDSNRCFLLLWTLVTPALFTFSGNILWTYILPSIAPFAMLLALALVRERQSPHRTTPQMLLRWAVPLSGVIAAVVFTMQPNLLKTEKSLVAFYRSHAADSLPLYYVGKQPFSAQYYSGGAAGSVDESQLAGLTARFPAGVYLAIKKDAPPLSFDAKLGPTLFENRSYTLVKAMIENPVSKQLSLK